MIQNTIAQQRLARKRRGGDYRRQPTARQYDKDCYSSDNSSAPDGEVQSDDGQEESMTMSEAEQLREKIKTKTMLEWQRQTTLTKNQRFDEFNDLQKYREIQRRTKLLYGVKDLKKIIDKSKESTLIFSKYHDKENSIKKESSQALDKEEGKKPFTIREFLKINQIKNIKLDNFIINSNSEWKQYFDTALLLVIGYTCLTTVFFVSYQSEQNQLMIYIDQFVMISFALDFLFNFFLEYQDKETFQRIREPKKIAMKYARSGWMFLDFIATFPFQYFSDVMWTKLIRLFRLTKLIALLDISRVKRLIKNYYENSQRADRAQTQQLVMFTYRIFRLIVIVFLFTYLIGSFWFISVRYINTNKDIKDRMTFITYFDLDQLWVDDGLCNKGTCAAMVKKCAEAFDVETCANTVEESDYKTCSIVKEKDVDQVPLSPVCCQEQEWITNNCQDVFTQVIIVCYFALTTLSTVGYGDLFPISMNEMLLGICFMLIGIVFFSKIMGNFIEIIQEYDRTMVSEEQGSELNNWMTLLTRFTNKPLSKTLINQIDQHFSFYWANDRLKSIKKDDEFLNQCPLGIKKHLILKYLFDDVIYKFRSFFNTVENMDTKFLYDICFGLLPAKFDFSDDINDSLILDEEDEVTHMYFIQEGVVGIGYYLMTQGLSQNQFRIAIKLQQYSYICDYYVCFDKKCEFIYMTVENIVAMQLEKQFLLREIFPKYPKIAVKIKETSEKRYKNNVREVLLNERQRHINDVNKQTSYKQINIVDYKEGQENDKKPAIRAFDKDQERSFLQTPIGSINESGIGGNFKSATMTKPGTSNTQKSSTMSTSGRNLKHNGTYSKTSSADFIDRKCVSTEMPNNETNISLILRKRLEGIENQMNDFSHCVHDFSILADQEISNLTVNMGKLQMNLNQVHNINDYPSQSVNKSHIQQDRDSILKEKAKE